MKHTVAVRTALSPPLPLDRLRGLDTPVTVIVHSFEGSIYRASALVHGVEYRLLEDEDRPLQRRSIQLIRAALDGIPISKTVLRQQSAYDEMIGQPVREGTNTLEVPLATDATGTQQAPPSRQTE